MTGLHIVDLLVVAAYLGGILYIGKRASKAAASEEGFFLAGRKLGKAYQFFLNFGNATDVNGAVSTASLVYQQGASGVWLAFQTIFMNPYYWFMNMWFRRVRLVTMAELFVDRLGSHGLARFYAIFQVVFSVMLIGWGNLVGYKVTASLMPKPESVWTVEERRQVEQHRELQSLEKQAKEGNLPDTSKQRLAQLRDLAAHGQLRAYISYIKPVAFYVVFTAVVGLYLMMGGMAATAKNEVFQGLLIVIFSALLIPFGLRNLGGVDGLREHVPAAMFELLGSAGSAQFTLFSLLAILLVSIVQINGIMGNMGVSGSAKDEYAARFGAVSGTYAKRLMIIMWTFVGLIAVGIYRGTNKLSDPDVVWGALSRDLLVIPGLFGLMLAGVLAAKMSNLATQSIATSALFVRNVYAYLAPERTEKQGVLVGRLTIAAILVIGLLVALTMEDIVIFLRLQLTMNVPWGAAIVLIFFWRRLTPKAVWATVVLHTVVLLVLPFCLQYVPAVARHPAATAFTQPASAAAKPVPLFFDKVVRENPADLASPLVGRERFNVEAWLLSRAGLELSRMSSSDLLAVQFYFDGAFPFVALILFSLLTRPMPRDQVDFFYGKMKTPVAASPELDAAAIEETRRAPHRFDHLKLLPHSNWEWTRWDRVDAVGFFACCAVSGGIIWFFWALLKWASGA